MGGVKTVGPGPLGPLAPVGMPPSRLHLLDVASPAECWRVLILTHMSLTEIQAEILQWTVDALGVHDYLDEFRASVQLRLPAFPACRGTKLRTAVAAVTPAVAPAVARPLRQPLRQKQPSLWGQKGKSDHRFFGHFHRFFPKGKAYIWPPDPVLLWAPA